MRLLSTLFMAMVVVVAVSGCTTGGDTETEVISKDMLEVTSIEAVPSDVIKPSTTVSMVLRVENVGQDDVWMLVDSDDTLGGDNFDGDMMLVNYCDGLYTLKSFDVLSTTSPCETRTASYDFNLMGEDANACYIKFMPGQTHVFQWKINAPEADDLGWLTNDCDLDFQTIYAGIATTYTYVYFATPREVAQRIYTDQDLTGTGDNIASYGPVYVNFETGEPQPISSGSEDYWTVYLNVNNVGDGVADINDIILYLGSTNIDGLAENYGFNSDGDEADDGSSCDFVFDNYANALIQRKDNTQPEDSEDTQPEDPVDSIYDEDLVNKLQIFNTKTSTFTCTLPAPTDVFVLKPYRFKAVSHYSYSEGYDFTIKTDPNP